MGDALEHNDLNASVKALSQVRAQSSLYNTETACTSELSANITGPTTWPDLMINISGSFKT
jgi:hypothetical protein